jgi:dimeric dUTPase (all-alpha-NTP-PPase superfamily)
MNLKPLFELQAKLDQHIIDKHGLHGQDLLPKKILALQVELGELANEWRGFKFWSEDQEPRTKHGYGLVRPGEWRNPLLEEYVDCLHFILSIGLEVEAEEWDLTGLEPFKPYENEITEHFIDVISYVNGLRNIKGCDDDYDAYRCTLEIFIGLGEMLGFTWREIESAYMIKNQVNHERQENGY